MSLRVNFTPILSQSFGANVFGMLDSATNGGLAAVWAGRSHCPSLPLIAEPLQRLSRRLLHARKAWVASQRLKLQ